MSDMTEDELTRLVVARFTPGRFKGRQDLEVSAQRGDPVALAKLEMKLGLADESALRNAYEQRINRWIVKGSEYTYPKNHPRHEILKALAKTPPGKRLPVVEGFVARNQDWAAATIRDLIPPEDLERIRQKQHNRLRKAADPNDGYWYRGNPNLSTFERVAKDRLEVALRKSGRIGSRRFYQTRIRTVPVGEERVNIEKLPAWFRVGVGRGWGAALKKEWQYDPEGYTRLTWYVSSALLNKRTKELQARNKKHVYLSPTKRIRPGRGASIITEIPKKTQMVFPWGVERPGWMRVKVK